MRENQKKTQKHEKKTTHRRINIELAQAKLIRKETEQFLDSVQDIAHCFMNENL